MWGGVGGDSVSPYILDIFTENIYWIFFNHLLVFAPLNLRNCQSCCRQSREKQSILHQAWRAKNSETFVLSTEIK